MGCQAPAQIPIYIDILNTFSNPTLCFPYDQTSSTCTFQSDMYGGCHPEANKCKVHTVGDTTRGAKEKMFTKIQDRLYITISDPWDQSWEKGVRGKLYESGQAFPRGTIDIKREWTTVNPTLTEVLNTQAQVSSNILKTEQALKQRIQSDPYPHSLRPAGTQLSWARVIRETVQFVNTSHILSNVSNCFLCTSLQCPPGGCSSH